MACKRLLGKMKKGIEGGIADEARYLGPVFGLVESYNTEVERRCEAAKNAFFSLGGFWKLRLPNRFRRMVLWALCLTPCSLGWSPS